jgi:outer membrane lipoprotein SlyB
MFYNDVYIVITGSSTKKMKQGDTLEKTIHQDESQNIQITQKKIRKRLRAKYKKVKWQS